MDGGASVDIAVVARDLAIADAAARSLPSGVTARLSGGRLALFSDLHDAARLRRIWKAAFATELALVRGADDRARSTLALLG